jgi:hypothetical protein
VFNNPDGFAMAFSDAWDSFDARHPAHGLSRDERLDAVMAELADHPFLQDWPEQAHQLAQFRMRLLNY